MSHLPSTINLPSVVSPAEWKAAREALLVKEKEAKRARDALAAERRRLPMFRIDKDYVFEGPDGKARLLDLFEGRRQLILDLTPLGRQEAWEDSPAGYPQTPPYQWWRRHDEYEDPVGP
jgi:predicted dithiol-disulfide oxidoreductase (DUF899 family)